MRTRPTLGKVLLNLVIGGIILAFAIYCSYMVIKMFGFSWDRATIIEDAFVYGWNPSREYWYNYVVNEENLFRSQNSLYYIVTSIPVLGKFVFTLITMFLLWFSGNILKYNTRWLSRLLRN